MVLLENRPTLMEGRMDGWMDGRMNVYNCWIDGYMSRMAGLNGSMNDRYAWLNVWADERMDGSVFSCIGETK